MQHPEITNALRDGYPSWQQPGNVDCQEMRAQFLEEYKYELLDWIKKEHPDLVEDWMKEAGYQQWLNDE